MFKNNNFINSTIYKVIYSKGFVVNFAVNALNNYARVEQIAKDYARKNDIFPEIIKIQYGTLINTISVETFLNANYIKEF